MHLFGLWCRRSGSTGARSKRAFHPLLETLERAEHSIDLLQFSFAIDDGKGEINEKLDSYKVAQKLVEIKRKKGSGIRIRLYIEGSRDTSARNRITAEYLERNGIEVRYGATHAKATIVDGKTVFFGSTNLTTQSLSRNNETNVLIHENPELVKGFSEYFEKLWNVEPRQPRVLPESVSEGGVQLHTDSAYKKLLLELIRSATKSVDFSIYYFNDREIERSLIKAHGRGVAVRGYVNQHRSFGLNLVERNRATVRRLHEAGLSGVHFDLPNFFSHSKYIIVDGKSVALGTGNWNKSDFERHPQLYVRIENPELAKALSGHLSQQIAYEADRPNGERLYHRFWIGWRRPDVSAREFDRAIDRAFIDATVVTSSRRGLHAYQPVLVDKGGTVVERNGSQIVIPDEIALVTYNDQETYRAIRESEFGREYGPLHAEYFLMERGHPQNSHSTVPETYKGEVNVGRAYDLSEAGVNWQKGASYFSVTLRKEGIGEGEYLRSLGVYMDWMEKNKSRLGVTGYALLVEGDFIVEYVNTAQGKRLNKLVRALESARSRASSLDSKAWHSQRIARQHFGSTKVVRSPDRGAVSVLFEQTIAPQDIMKKSQLVFTRASQEQTKRQEQIRQQMREGRNEKGELGSILSEWPCRDLLVK